MSWQKEVDELQRRKALAAELGGPEKVERQRQAGRLTARERIDAMADPGSFHEFGEIAGASRYGDDNELESFTPSNFLFGRATIDGRPAVVSADDFTVRGGAVDAAIHRKLVEAKLLASEYRMPLIRMIEGTGGGGSVKTLEQSGYSYIPEIPGWDRMVSNLSEVPIVSLGLGPVAGLGAGRMVMSHYSVLVEGQAQMFVAGPPVVAAVGEKRTKEELGGAHIHAANGAVDDTAESEADAFAKTRRFLSYLPSSVHELPQRRETGDRADRTEDWLIEAVPRNPRSLYKVRPILEAVFDQGSLFEIGKRWGTAIVTAFARLDGWPVAVLASDPMALGGLWTADTARKVERFVDLAELFHLPVVHMVDNPGFMIGLQAERDATIRWGCRTLTSIYQASVPWCALIMRKAYGMAGSAHANASRFHWRMAWPSGDWGSLPIEGGLEAAYKSDLEKADDPEAELAAIKARLDAVRSPFRTAEKFGVEEIIDPRETRARLCAFAETAQRALVPGPRSFGYRS
ncbi:methylmalonyl-CoA carboxyltransferase [Pacificimonas flava]|uniref:Methylmalonyl-CoA carboxyltransferase n=2 Tax=Pacificimonas TaxID=1960290 RepID=A0A219B7A1_9SPHN|nr:MULTISPECIES: carboxyl transferase domain-containing protein [Pacificimonas]MBZ6378460.1 methylmalonyl-CoA carboxyltransferase [Pacificimonas aurantium]OWV34245.1 methylmalonyl-CoA carboxyltransferase [Pacificimonas flava]